ncbi:beta subunit of tetrameric clathrin adaptor complex AP1 [Thalassiosira pseudonana CCMP1335]|uniref:Beta subunit of tetrameric clathrin adaptor complex AP1 n=1 Tax=Thalassiosira pseudonana TaxID=35128 RepID=B8C7W7_THAPS|nr:beta subunit of tetrameric clathrin adaptor complex AP1 [Thalassiosira pseudonana CCMP1335]EED90182.1 beta subunit of tetrameric clathrin adaptor complex AP1 [Thalassiosira pseudonana CCMP1335]
MAPKDTASSGGSDSRFFNTPKKGEMHELRMELQSTDRTIKVDAVKKVIASMTVGKDVSTLFTDVLNCAQTANIELKKLVYLYLINYAKSQPELTLLAVNTFVKDANDTNPLIRALAVRTMGCIRVDRITEYLCEPLSRALRDNDPYVRKTAAVCVAKLYDIAPELVQERGFIETLHDLISDSNPSVVANGVAALSEISETSGRDVMKISASVLQKLLAALNECTEWGQVFILDSLAKYTPADAREAEGIIERVTPRLQHANSAVVMSAVKVILSYMDVMGGSGGAHADSIRALTRKLAPPLVTLLNSEPEIQYVALRNINLIVQKRSNILENEIKVFFCKYNDPIYVKMEKLEIIIKLVSEKNIDQVLLELKEYATEVDVDFVRKSVSAIGRCAVKLERAAERCIGVLLELIQTKVNYVVQESVIVIKDIFRRYPNRYESIIATLCDNLDTLDEPQAKASMIWIIGEYAERIDNADELLDTFLETFEEEDPAVQLQLLTATVKCFLKDPENCQEMVQRVLDLATEESDNPDLRDRGFIYWRLLSTDPEAAKLVVLGDKPVIEDDTFRLEPNLLNVLVGQIATLSSIYHKPPEAFVVRAKRSTTNGDDLGVGDVGEEIEEGEEEDYEDENDVNGGGGDLLDMGGLSVNDNTSPSYSASGLDNDLFGAPSPVANEPEARMSKVCAPEKSGGIELWAGFRQVNGAVKLELDVRNISSTVPVSTLAIQLNKNSFGLSPATQQIVCNPPVPIGGSGKNSVELVVNPNMLVAAPAGQPASPQIQVAIKNMATGLVFYFAANFAFEALFTPDGALERTTFIESWKSIDDKKELYGTVSDLPPASTDIDQVAAKFKAHRIFLIARRPVPNAEGQEVAYFSMKTSTGMVFMAELTFKKGVNAAKVCLKTENIAYGVQAKVALESLLRAQ